MKLTVKDKEFLEKLKRLADSNELEIQLKLETPIYLILKKNYGDHIETSFQMTRQGIRWRFQRLFNEIYVSAYETIYFIESNFGTTLRKDAIAIVKQRIELRKNAQKMGKL